MEGCTKNCSEADKMLMFVRLLVYFMGMKKEVFPFREEDLKEEEEILRLMEKCRMTERTYDVKDTNS